MPSADKSNAAVVAKVLAVDIGNTSMHFGVFASDDAALTPLSTLILPSADADYDQLEAWLPKQLTSCYVASVVRKSDQQLCDWFETNRPEIRVTVIPADEFPIAVQVDEPKRVGADRIAAAVAANHLRSPNRAAIVVDSGTAITVDAVDQNGLFLGGAVAPGWRVSANALYQIADQLPLIDPIDSPPPVIGTNTEAAMRSGLFWGSIGAVRELVIQTQRKLDCACDVFVTGGGGKVIVEQIGNSMPDLAVSFDEHLVLSGIVIARRKQQAKD